MGEVQVTTLEWNGPVEIGHRLIEIIPEGITVITDVSGKLITLKLRLEDESLDALRERVDELLALFSTVED
jgi:hypothetical protein